MKLRTRAVGALAFALTLAAAAACTDDAKNGGDAAEGQASDEDRLLEMVNESSRIESELDTIQLRIVQRCLEDAGFAVHDEVELMGWEAGEITDLFTDYPFAQFMPTTADAEAEGFGFWAETEEAQAEEGADTNAATEVQDGIEEMPDNSAWEALSPQEQYDWYEAFHGAEAAEEYYAFLIDPDAPNPHEEGGRGGSGDTGEDGEIGISDGPVYTAPEPGGCEREMIDALYGDGLRLVEEIGLESGETEAYWQYRPENPTWNEEAMEGIQAEYRERIVDVEAALVDCLAERGHPDWEFNEWGSLPIEGYFYELYWGEDEAGDHPLVPDDVPDDFEGKKAHEIELATDFAECGDESGYRETASQAYTDTQVEYFESVETATYAWQEEMRSILETAQKLLEA